MSMLLDALGRPYDEPKAEKSVLTMPKGGGELAYIEGGQMKVWNTKSAQNPYSDVGPIRRLIWLNASNLAQLPLSFFQGGQKLPTEGYQDPGEVDLRTILNNPNPNDSKVKFYLKHWSYYMIYDRVYWLLNRNPAGYIKEIYCLNPALTETITKDGVIQHYIYNRKIKIMPEDMFVHSGFNASNPTGDGGTPILDSIKFEYEIDYYTSKYGKKFFENSARASGVITVDKDVPTTKEDMEAVLTMWKKAHQGSENAYKVGALLSGMSYTELGQTMADMEFIEGRKDVKERMIEAFGVPKSVYGLTEKIDRATAETHARVYWQFTLKPMAVMLQEDINLLIKQNSNIDKYRNIIVKYDFSTVEELKKDLNETLEAAKKLMEIGYPRNQVNERLHLDMPEDTEDGETRYMPTLMMEVGYSEPAPEPLPVPNQDEEDNKAIDKVVDKILDEEKAARITALKNRYLRTQKKEERRFVGKLQKYILEQRNTVLKIMSGNKSTVDLADVIGKIKEELNNQDRKLVKKTTPLMTEASRKASQIALENLGSSKQAIVDAAVVEARANMITGINDTIFKTLQRELSEGISGGESLDELTSRVKKVYGFSKTQAKTIARTETANIMSGTTFNTYKNEGVQYKEWLTAGDGAVRDTHSANQAAGAIHMNESFPGTGEAYPGESEINCRCVLVPVIK